MKRSSFAGEMFSQKRSKHKIEEKLYSKLDHVAQTQTNKAFAFVKKKKDASPKSTTKDRLLKSKSNNSKSNNSIQNIDANNNKSIIDNNQSPSNVVTEKSIPNIDYCESDSRNFVPDVDGTKSIVENEKLDGISDKSIDNELFISDTPKTQKTQYSAIENTTPVLDSTDNECITQYESTTVDNGNFKLLKTPKNCEYEPTSQADVKLGSTKIPPILFEGLDFDHLKCTETTKRRRKFSVKTIQAEMEKFYNESWGGENFDHTEIQKSMSRDESLWAIDPEDKMRTPYKRQVTYHDESCNMKPPVCYMCGESGHYEPACPHTICLNCGSQNGKYSTKCFNCSNWRDIRCEECGQMGHPNSHCPDLWRRYHNTIDDNTPLHKNRYLKERHQLFCSGCAQRGHLVHNCHLSTPFSDLPINSPYVAVYKPVYSPDNSNIVQDTNSQVNPNNSFFINYRNNLQSKSCHGNDRNKTSKSQINSESQLNSSFCKDLGQYEKQTNETNAPIMTNKVIESNTEKAPDYIILDTANLDVNGQVVQDNVDSEPSEFVTSSHIDVTAGVIKKLQTDAGKSWLAENMNKYNDIVEFTGNNSYLSIKGKIADQKSFFSVFRESATGKKEIKNEDKQSSGVLKKVLGLIGSIFYKKSS